MLAMWTLLICVVPAFGQVLEDVVLLQVDRVDARRTHPGSNDLAWLLGSECYPGDEHQELWRHLRENVSQCLTGLTDELIEALSNSQHFCPEVRHQETGPVTQGWCKQDGSDADQSCVYPEANSLGEMIFDQPGNGHAPGLYADKSKLRYSDPLYLYPKGSPLEVANAPKSPFINVNQMYEDAEHSIWAGQCPLAGFDERNQLKSSTVCHWLGFLRAKRVDMLVSLSPSPLERAQSAVKARCTDYIWEKKGMGYDQAKGTGCEGLPYEVTQEQIDIPLGDSGNVSNIFVRKVTWGDFNFKQLYFNSWPDAYGRPNPPVPSEDAISMLLNYTAMENRVAVHCAGGRGRSGTLVLGTIQKWKGTSSTEQIVNDLVSLRARRADMIEHPTQLMLLGKVLGLSSDECGLVEGTA